MKLKASIATRTNGAGIISHGAFAMAFRFWDSERRVPQLMVGGLSPNPKKLSEVSAIRTPSNAFPEQFFFSRPPPLPIPGLTLFHRIQLST